MFSLAYVSGILLLYFKVGPSIYISLFLACASRLSERAPHLRQLVGPAPSVGVAVVLLVGFLGQRVFALLSHPWSVGTDFLLGRGSAAVRSPIRPYLLCTSFLAWVLIRGWHAPLTGPACQAASLGHSRLVLTEWCQHSHDGRRAKRSS